MLKAFIVLCMTMILSIFAYADPPGSPPNKELVINPLSSAHASYVAPVNNSVCFIEALEIYDSTGLDLMDCKYDEIRHNKKFSMSWQSIQNTEKQSVNIAANKRIKIYWRSSKKPFHI